MKRLDDIMRDMGGEPTPGMPSAEAFWAGFRSRAGLRLRDSPPSGASTALRWAAMASPLAAAALLLLILHPMLGARAQADTVINSLEVEAAYRAVFIMNDEPTKSTIVWVDWGQANPSNGDAG